MHHKLLFFLIVPLLAVGCNGNEGKSKDDKGYKYISVHQNPDKVEYIAGEYFDPTGLILTATDKKDVQTQIEYAGNEELFTFSPSLTTKLKVEDIKVTVTFEKLTTEITIKVEEEELNKFTVDFNAVHEQEGTVKPVGQTGDESAMEKLLATFNTYYFTDEDIALSSISGGYLQIQNIDITASRLAVQTMILTSRSNDLDFTFTFSTKIKKVTFVCEAYCKYISYTGVYNVDHDTSLTINGTKKNISAHTASDVDETQNLTFTVNNKSVHMVVPNNYLAETVVQRVLLHKMILEY